MVYEFQRFGFKHEAKELLIGFSFENDRFAIEPFVEKDFIGWELLKSGIAKDEPAVHVANLFDKEVMIREDLFEVYGPNLFIDGYHHKAECRRKGTSHWTSSSLTDATLAQGERLHVKGRGEKGWDILDDNLPGDVQSTERAAFDEISWIVGFSWIDGEDLVVSNV